MTTAESLDCSLWVRRSADSAARARSAAAARSSGSAAGPPVFAQARITVSATARSVRAGTPAAARSSGVPRSSARTIWPTGEAAVGGDGGAQGRRSRVDGDAGQDLGGQGGAGHRGRAPGGAPAGFAHHAALEAQRQFHLVAADRVLGPADGHAGPGQFADGEAGRQDVAQARTDHGDRLTALRRRPSAAPRGSAPRRAASSWAHMGANRSRQRSRQLKPAS